MSLLSQFGGGGGIKSIQRLTVGQSIISGLTYIWPTTVSISSVNTSKTIIIVNGSIGYFVDGSGQMSAVSTPVVSLSSSTSISLSGPSIFNPPLSGATSPGSINIQVVEFY